MSCQIPRTPPGQKLTWQHHIFTKRKQLGLNLTKMYWLLGRSSRLSLPYPQTHLDLWHPTLGHSIHIQHREARTLSIKGPAHNRRRTMVGAEQSHPSRPPNDFRQRRNPTLMELPDNRRLRKHVPNDLPNRFLVQLL
jgi:hypothetical protein